MEFLKWCRNEWERSVAVASIAAGLVAFGLGWWGQRDKALVVEQIPYVVSGALFGLLLIVIGTTAWLSADLHDEWAKLDRFEDAVTRGVAALESAGGREIATSAAARVEADRATDAVAHLGVPAATVNQRRNAASVAEAGT